jgi:hypothetical protein
MSCLATEPRKQFLAPNSIRKTGVIMAHGNKRCATAAAIHHHDLAPEAGEVNGGRQSRWSPAYDEAVEAAIAVMVAWALAAVLLPAVGGRLIALNWNDNLHMSMSSI